MLNTEPRTSQKKNVQQDGQADPNKRRVFGLRGCLASLIVCRGSRRLFGRLTFVVRRSSPRSTRIMTWNSRDILDILDQCCDTNTFPMLDNGYIYLAATRLSLFRSSLDWAIVIEVFGFSPRAGLPDTCIQTFASRLHNRNPSSNYVTHQAYEKYLANNSHNESRSVFPMSPGDWQDSETGECVAPDAISVSVRDMSIALPSADEFVDCGITLENPPQVEVFELCRFLAARICDQVLATPNERRVSVLPDMEQILLLDEWHHPNLVDDERASNSETFSQLADVLVTGDVSQ